MKIKNTIIWISALLLPLAALSEYPGFRVVGRHLYDPCGEKVILRGVANPNIWFQKSGLPQYTEIEKTGANVIRIVWQISGTAEQLDEAIFNCIDYYMIPMVECHDATGDWSKLDEVVDYWTRTDIADVLISHENYLLLNIANEAGDWAVSSKTFKDDYTAHIQKIRNAGIHVPLVIDGTDWGKNINILQANGPALIAADPDHSLLFSIHMWWPSMYGYTEQDIIDEIAESVNMELPIIVGEFSQMHGSCSDPITPSRAIAYQTIIEQCYLHEIGYIAWSWFGNCNPLWDMTTDGTYETLYDWGLEVAVTSEYSIKNTSVRPYFMENGDCEAVAVRQTPYPDSKGFELQPVFPNPFNMNSQIRYVLNEPADIQLDILDLRGSQVRTLIRRHEEPGIHEVRWDGRNDRGMLMPSGTYLVYLRFSSGQIRATVSERLLLVK
jgi:mannan endo-1,4-beta-mannosidase